VVSVTVWGLRWRGLDLIHFGLQKAQRLPECTGTPGAAVGLGFTVRYSAVWVGVNTALQCGWGWG